MDTYIKILFSILIHHETPVSTLKEFYEMYLVSLAGPLFEPLHLEHLSKAIKIFLTDNQTCRTAESALGFMQEAWDQFDRIEGKTEPLNASGSRKKRRVTDFVASEGSHQFALILSLSAHLSITVFTSLPIHSVSETTRQELYHQLSITQEFTWSCLNKVLQRIHKSRHDTQSHSIIAASILRLQYALDSFNSTPPVPLQGETHFNQLSEALQDDHLLPELRLEIVR